MPVYPKALWVTIGAALTMFTASTALSQINGDVSPAISGRGEPWRAHWITAPGASRHDAGVFRFRRSFDIQAIPHKFNVRVSADNRYRLFINGHEVSSGPARGDLANWRYETVDIAQHLRPGRNVLAALVWNWGNDRPLAQISHRTGFLLQADDPWGAMLDTGSAWKVQVDTAYRFDRVRPPGSGDFYAAAPGETMNARMNPWGWEQLEFDDAQWPSAVPSIGLVGESGSSQAAGADPFGWAGDWQLVPRELPTPENSVQQFARLRWAKGIEASSGFLGAEGDLIVPAHSRVSLLLDQDRITLGYPVLRASGGAGAEAVLTYAESLFDSEGKKGNRNDVEGKTIRGLRDKFMFDGGNNRTFKTLWLRAWRYVQIDVTTAENPLRIHDFHSVFSAYPMTQRAQFDSDAVWLKPIWKLNWQALRLSTFETFWDAPYYEQLQYVGDSRIAALLSVYQAGDSRLMRNAIEQFDSSRSAEGLTASSWPSSVRQQIPGFSLWWIAMVHDYWMLENQPDVVRRMLPGIRGVIAWHERHIDETGLLGPMPWWNFLDWAIGWERGVPPGGGTGHSVALTLQFALVLKQAAEMEDALGRSSEAAHNRALAARLVQAARTFGWDAARGIFLDEPGGRRSSQQTNALAVLAGAVAQDEKKELMEHVLSDASLTQATFYFRFYVDEALREAGLADRYLDRLGPWSVMVKNGMTSTAETPEPTRSDSHVWSAHPNYHLLATVAGIRPSSPGFGEVMIAPALGWLRSLSATMPHPAGIVSVNLSRLAGRRLRADIKLPDNISAQFRWGKQELRLTSSGTVICGPDACRHEQPSLQGQTK